MLTVYLKNEKTGEIKKFESKTGLIYFDKGWRHLSYDEWRQYHEKLRQQKHEIKH